jgi:mannose/cellobiose epimerase-like protein (N-acyl-D-glucosamine 2-epimerase family)
MLLAFAAAASVCGADIVDADAAALLNYLRVNFSHPAGGYKENIPDRDQAPIPSDLPRRQNPHMHPFEACLAADEAFGDEGGRERSASGQVSVFWVGSTCPGARFCEQSPMHI